MSYAWKRSQTLDHTKCGSSDSTDFPVLFNTTDATFKTVGNGGHVQNSNGYDFAFFSDSGLTTPLNFDLKYYNASTGQIVAHVKVPTVSHSSDTVIYVGYGDSGISTYQGNNSGTWNSGFQAVYPLGNGSTLDVTDHTSNANNGTNHSASAASGLNDGAASFNGSSSYVGVPDANSLDSTSTMTIELLLNATDWTGGPGGEAEFVKKNGNYIFRKDALGGSPSLSLIYWDGSSLRYMLGSLPLFATWHHLMAVVASNDCSAIYVDGVAVNGSPATLFSGSPDYTNPITIGDDGAGVESFHGLIENLRISTGTARSADWALTSANNQLSPSTFYTLGSETATGGGGATYNQSVLAQCTPVPTLIRQTGKARLVSNTPVPSVVRQATKSAKTTNTPVPLLTRSTGKKILGSNTPVPTLASIKTKLQSVLASCTPNPTLSRQAAKPLLTSNTPVPTIVRQTAKSRLVTNTPVPSVSALKVFLRAVQAQCTPNPTLTRQAGKVIQGSNTPVPTMARQIGKVVRTTNTPVPAMVRAVTKTLLASCTPAPALTLLKVVLKSLQAMTTPVPTMVRAIGKSILGSSTPVPSLSKSTAKALQATASALASLVTQFTRGGLGPVLEPLVAFTRRFRANYTVTFRAIYTALIRGKNMPSARPLPEVIAVIQRSTIGLDFGRMPLPDGVFLTGTPTVTISVYDGTDDSPQSRLTSGPQIGTIPTSKGGSGVENAAIKFQFGNAVAGVTYLIVASCATTDGDVVAGETHIPAVAPQ